MKVIAALFSVFFVVIARGLSGGDSIYGKPFADEFHQRIKFNHRSVDCEAVSVPWWRAEK